eukprot:7380947-Prymnesium_polylepis.1
MSVGSCSWSTCNASRTLAERSRVRLLARSTSIVVRHNMGVQHFAAARPRLPRHTTGKPAARRLSRHKRVGSGARSPQRHAQ